VRNDLFLAHESIYAFAARFARHRRVLDGACGTGYGSHLLASSGAGGVLGIDLHPQRVRYARRHFHHPNLAYRVADCDRLELSPESFDFIVSSNTLEHLGDPTRFLRSADELLTAEGQILVAVPPVLSEADVAVHAHNRYHAVPRSVQAWADLFLSMGWQFRFFAHRCSAPIDLTSPARTRLSHADFAFQEGSLGSAYDQAPITATYLLRRAA